MTLNIGVISAQLGGAMILYMVPWQHWKVWEERKHMPHTGTLVENVLTIKSKNKYLGVVFILVMCWCHGRIRTSFGQKGQF